MNQDLKIVMDEGWKAFENNQHRNANPYEPNTPEWQAWWEGWMNAFEYHVDEEERA